MTATVAVLTYLALLAALYVAYRLALWVGRRRNRKADEALRRLMRRYGNDVEGRRRGGFGE